MRYFKNDHFHYSRMREDGLWQSWEWIDNMWCGFHDDGRGVIQGPSFWESEDEWSQMDESTREVSKLEILVVLGAAAIEENGKEEQQ